GAIITTDTALDGAINGVARHVLAQRLVHRRTQTRVIVDFSATETRGRGDLADQLGKDFSFPGILGRLAVLDVRPFAVACHNNLVLLLLPCSPARKNCARTSRAHICGTNRISSPACAPAHPPRAAASRPPATAPGS